MSAPRRGACPHFHLIHREKRVESEEWSLRPLRKRGLQYRNLFFISPHLEPRSGPPSPKRQLGVRSCSARYLMTRFNCRSLLLPIAYCLLPLSTVHSSLLTPHFSAIAYCLLPTASVHCPLSTVHSSLLTSHSSPLFPTVHCPLFTDHS